MEIDKEEVRKAINGNRSALFYAFVWSRSPQGHTYWARQFHGEAPIDVAALRSMLGETDTRLTAGETYTAKNGGKWECIFVRDGIAWMTHGTGTAYTWNADTGENICQGGGAYNIVFTETRRGTVDYIDGVPQFDTWKEA